MKRLMLVASASLLAAAAAVTGVRSAWSAPPDTTLAVDAVHSSVLFKIKHMGASWTWGRFNQFTASVVMDENCAQITSVTFEVKKAESVDTGNEGRDKHLRSPDFFNAKQFADITFKSTEVKPASDGVWDVSGDLTMHGVTKPARATVKKVGEGEMKGTKLIGFETMFTVKRSDFGMSTPVGPGSDDVTLNVSVETNRK